MPVLSTIIIGDVAQPRPAHDSRSVEPANWERKNIPFLDDKPERADEKEAAFRRFFAELGARLFSEAAGAD